MPHARERRWPLAALALLLTLAALLLAGGGGARSADAPLPDAAAWRGFVDGRRSAIAVGQRMIVVLDYPSLASKVAEAGGQASESEMRQWTAAALAAQKQIAARLSREGVRIEPDFIFSRTFNGFAAALDARALALLERDEDVVGVYPVRIAYPAAAHQLPDAEYVVGVGRTGQARVPGLDGAGITIALLDTGVDATHPYLRGRIAEGFDLLDPESSALPRQHPEDPALVEEHGTQTAGLLVGRDGPRRLEGTAPGATLLPIRVAGWQPNSEGGFSVYGRTDQLLAGLERAVDPNDDGSAMDAVRVAVVGVAEPFAAFTDGPVARAVGGATRLDTLVVAPAGNDGPAGPGYGSIAGPGGAPAALTVGAADSRARTATARVVVRAGLRVLLDRVVPLGGAVSPSRTLSLQVVRPAEVGARRPQTLLARFFDPDGYSIVAGRAALLARSAAPGQAESFAAQAGAAAILVEGVVPAGALGLDERVPVPVVGVPATVARDVRAALARGVDVRVALGAPSWGANRSQDVMAPFSSHGLAFGGGVKPEVVAPGVELLTADVGRNADRTSRYGTVSGSSAAAALVGGAAALVAQARPNLDAESLKSVLVGTAAPLGAADASSRGGGLVDPTAALVAEVAAAPATVSFGAAVEPGWTAVRQVRLRNVSSRRLTITVAAEVEGIAGVSVAAKPERVQLAPGRRRTVRLTAKVTFLPRGLGAIGGVVRLESSGGGELALPWAVALPVTDAPLLGAVRLSVASFRASDQAPAVLSVRAGGVANVSGKRQLQPLERLDVELWWRHRRIGLLARLRDVLPGSYAFGITGRGPLGRELQPGPYRLRVLAVPPAGEHEARSVDFRIR
jgi:subtilisin family serine protease